MLKIKNSNLFLGHMYDFESIRDSSGWSIVHCCKDPYHKELVGYSGNLDPNHPYYAYAIFGNRMALNLVDLEQFNPSYLEFNYKMFKTAFQFIDVELKLGKKVLIHCNEGLSRAPMVLLMYLKHSCVDGYEKLEFNDAIKKFVKDNNYTILPKHGIYNTARQLWTRL